jgi:hypothetical protein
VLIAIVTLLTGASGAQASVTFSGDFETGDLSQWNFRQFCNDDATVYSADSQPTWPAPAEGTYALRMSVADTHVLLGATMNCQEASGNPRGQVMGDRGGPQSLGPRDDRWEAWSVLIPSDFPLVSGRNWFLLQEDFGSPFSGSPPVEFDIADNGSGVNHFVMSVCHDACGAVSMAWSGPEIQTDRWYRFVVHKTFSRSDDTGMVQLWLDGERETFVNGSRRYYTRTLHANCTCLPTDQYRFYLNNYRADALSPDVVTVYFDDAVLGTAPWDVF